MIAEIADPKVVGIPVALVLSIVPDRLVGPFYQSA